MPLLYDGLPDRPAWLRERFLRPSKREVREWFAPRHFAYNEQARMRDKVQAAIRRTARLRRVYEVSTDPVTTFGLTLLGGSFLALQLDRLTDDAPGGSWALLLLAALAVALGGWLSRTRAVVEERFAAEHQDQVDRAQLAAIDESIAESLEGGVSEEIRLLADQVAKIRQRLG